MGRRETRDLFFLLVENGGGRKKEGKEKEVYHAAAWELRQRWPRFNGRAVVSRACDTMLREPNYVDSQKAISVLDLFTTAQTRNLG